MHNIAPEPTSEVAHNNSKQRTRMFLVFLNRFCLVQSIKMKVFFTVYLLLLAKLGDTNSDRCINNFRVTAKIFAKDVKLSSWSDLLKLITPRCAQYTTHIYVNERPLTKVEENSLASYPSLVNLDISYNQISHISQKAFSKNPKLEVIYMRGNKIRCLPDFGDVHKNIRIIILNGNKITECKNDAEYNVIFAKLNRLSLFNNSLTKLPNIVYHAKSLKTLDLRFNRLTILPDLSAFIPWMLEPFYGMSYDCVRWLEGNKILNVTENVWMNEFCGVKQCRYCSSKRQKFFIHVASTVEAITTSRQTFFSLMASRLTPYSTQEQTSDSVMYDFGKVEGHVDHLLS